MARVTSFVVPAISWQMDCRRLLALIDAVIEAGRFMATARAAEAAGHHAEAMGLLVDRIVQAFDLMEQLRKRQDRMPLTVYSVLGAYVDGVPKHARASNNFADVVRGITSLALFKADFEYVLSDVEEAARSLVRRAFLHLQRSIVADGDVQQRWAHAFDKRETACEKLGGAHLLQHGIWGFKASAAGEQTDLVLGEPLDLRDAEGAAVTLVLTEWKCVSTNDSPEEKAKEGRRQAAIYAGGSLAGFELRSARYVVLVSGPRLPRMEPIEEHGVIYHHVNVAVSPAVPSTESRRSRPGRRTGKARPRGRASRL